MARHSELTFFLLFIILATGWLVVYGNSCDNDTTSPVSNHTITPSPNAAGWNNSAPVTFAITTADNCGVESIHYKLDGGAEETVLAATAAVAVSEEGLHTVEYWAVDNVGNVETPHNTATVKIDKTPPEVPGNLTPADGTVTNDTTPTLSWSAPNDTGGSGIKNYRYQVDDDPDFSSPLKNGYTTNTHYTPSLNEGTYYWRVRARDNAGNNGDWSDGRTLIIDTTPPTAPTGLDMATEDDTGCSNADNITKNTTGLTISGSAEANSTVKIKEGSTVLGTGTANGSGDFSIDIDLSEGIHSITATATDAAGNESGEATPISIRVDTIPPVLTVTSGPSPAWPPNFVSSLTSGTAQISDPGGSGVDENSCEYKIDSSSYVSWPIPGGVISTNLGTVLAAAGVSGDGPHVLHGRVKDMAGNEFSGSSSFTLDDTAPSAPTVISTSHAIDVWSKDNTIDFQWFGASDGSGSGVAGYSFLLDTSPNTDPDKPVDMAHGTDPHTWTSPPLADGDGYYFHLRTVDNLGNWSGTAHLGPFKIDTQKPEVPGNLSPADGAVTNDTTPTLSWSAPNDTGGSGIKNYRYQVDNDPDFSSPLKNGYTTNTHYTPTLSAGTYYWRVRARDNAGNNGDWSDGRTLIIDTEPPQITCPVDISQANDPGSCGAVVTWTEPAVTDNVGVASVSCDPPSGSVFPVGTTTVTCTATDLAGNTFTCSFDVTVNDTENPVISTCPGGITVDYDPGSCSAVVSWSEPIGSDNCGIATFSSDHSPSEFFPVGTTTVTYTATDIHGNCSTCSFDVTVNDVEPPATIFVTTSPTPDNNATPYFEWIGVDNNSCTAPADLLYSTKLDEGNWSDWSAATSITLDPLPEGTHTFRVRAKDEAGNIGSTTDYTWLLDLTGPEVTIMVPEDGADYGLNATILTDWTAIDALSGLATVAGTVPSGEAIDTSTPGLHNFTVTATDLAGNTTTVTATYRVVYTVNPGGAAGGGGAAGETGSFLDKSIAGGGGVVGIIPLEGIYTVGDVIHVSFTLSDISGNAITDALVTCTLVKVTIDGEGESYEILNLWSFAYDEESGLYLLGIETAELQPGTYDLWLGFDDGTAERLRIQLLPVG